MPGIVISAAIAEVTTDTARGRGEESCATKVKEKFDASKARRKILWEQGYQGSGAHVTLTYLILRLMSG